MSNIIDFQSNRRDQNRSTAENQAQQAARLGAMKAALAANRPMAPSDQKTVAEAIWRLLDRLKGQGVSKAETLQKAGVSGEGDSTKHLGQFALNPDQPKESRNVSRLNKKPRVYKNIVNAAAQLTGADADMLLIEVFGATSLVTSHIIRSAAPEFDELAQRLCDIVDAVASKHDLKTYFHDVLRAGVQLRVSNEDDETEKKPLAADEIEISFKPGYWTEYEWPLAFFEKTNDFRHHDICQNVPAYPSIFLGDWMFEEDCRFQADNKEQDYSDEPVRLGAGEAVDGMWSVELRLCIIPTGQDLRPTPSFRVTVGTWCGLSHAFEGNVSNHFTKGYIPDNVPCDVRLWDIGTSAPKEFPLRLWRENLTLPPLLHTYFRDQGCNGCIFLPITGVVVKDWFDRFPFDRLSGHNVPLHVRKVGKDLLDFIVEDFTPFKARSLAAAFDHCLSGKGGSNPLDLLDNQAAQLVSLFNDASTIAREERDAGIAHLDSRLRQMHTERSSG